MTVLPSCPRNSCKPSLNHKSFPILNVSVFQKSRFEDIVDPTDTALSFGRWFDESPATVTSSAGDGTANHGNSPTRTRSQSQTVAKAESAKDKPEPKPTDSSKSPAAAAADEDPETIDTTDLQTVAVETVIEVEQKTEEEIRDERRQLAEHIAERSKNVGWVVKLAK